MSEEIYEHLEFLPHLSKEQTDRALVSMIETGKTSGGRDVGKLCPVCEAEYLAQEGVRLPALPGDEGITKEYCTQCAPGVVMVRTYLPKCWCGMTIRPREKYCYYHGHPVCRCPDAHVACPGWHDYSERFVEK